MIELDSLFWKKALVGVIVTNLITFAITLIICRFRGSSRAEWHWVTQYLPQKCLRCHHDAHHVDDMSNCQEKVVRQISVQKKRKVQKQVALPAEYEGGLRLGEEEDWRIRSSFGD